MILPSALPDSPTYSFGYVTSGDLQVTCGSVYPSGYLVISLCVLFLQREVR